MNTSVASTAQAPRQHPRTMELSGSSTLKPIDPANLTQLTSGQNSLGLAPELIRLLGLSAGVTSSALGPLPLSLLTQGNGVAISTLESDGKRLESVLGPLL